MKSSIVANAIKRFPLAEHWLALGDSLPPALRTRYGTRFLISLAASHPQEGLAATNLGISRQLKCLVPASQVQARFGKPSLYSGEFGALELAVALSGDADLFLDIGAHLGMFTFYVFQAGAANLPIRFMEPDPDLFRLIDRNVRDNRLDRIAGYEAAIGSADGTARFFVNRTDSMSGSLTEAFVGRHDVTPLDVKLRSLNSLARELAFTRACVKVDVENAEFAFLDGAGDAVDRVAYLIMEVLGPAHAQGFVPALVARSGFHAYYIHGLQLEPSRNGEFTYRAPDYNWLFCREHPRALAERLRGTALTVVEP